MVEGVLQETGAVFGDPNSISIELGLTNFTNSEFYMKCGEKKNAVQGKSEIRVFFGFECM